MSALTEEEASGKWCPAARVARICDHISPSGGAQWQQSVVAANRTEGGAAIGRCVGSECMAWRWAREPADGVYRPTNRVVWITALRAYASEPARPGWMTAEWLWDGAEGHWLIGAPVVDRGYCGLAGGPT